MLTTPTGLVPFGIVHGAAWLPKPTLPILTDLQPPDAGNPDLLRASAS